MGIEDAKKYLTAPAETSVDGVLALFELANTTASTLRILNDEFRSGIPEFSQSTSWKFRCPFGYEHSDGGLDKNCRFYWASDHGYCFALHGVLDPVGLRSLMWGVPKRIAAQRMLDAAGIGKRIDYRERMEEIRESAASVVRPASTTAASAALRASLSTYPDYMDAQYQPRAQSALQARLDVFDPDWDFDHVQRWVEESTRFVIDRLRD